MRRKKIYPKRILHKVRHVDKRTQFHVSVLAKCWKWAQWQHRPQYAYLKKKRPSLYTCFQLFWIISNVFLPTKSRMTKKKKVMKRTKSIYPKNYSYLTTKGLILLRYITRGYSYNSYFRSNMNIFCSHITSNMNRELYCKCVNRFMEVRVSRTQR